MNDAESTTPTLFEFSESRFLLCEGIDDKHFFEALLKQRGLPKFQIRHAAECNPNLTGGRSGFAPALNGIELIKGFAQLKGILIVSDNDSPGESFREVQRHIRQAGHTPPERPEELGMVAGKPMVVLMIPQPDLAGDLETVALGALFERWPGADGCSQRYLECTGAVNWEKAASLNKARARSIIVGYNQADPYKGLGYLFRDEPELTANPCFNDIAQILSRFDQKIGG